MDQILYEIKQIAIKYAKDISKVTLFGSRARGDQTARSDYDIAVYFKKEIVHEFLDEIDDIDTLLKIDVSVMCEGLDALFIDNVKKEERILFMGKFLYKSMNYEKAVKRLEELQSAKNQGIPEEILRDSTIQRFEFTYEMAWKTLKEFLLEMGLSPTSLPRQVIQLAYQHEVIGNESVWLQMIKDRNIAAHQYNEAEIKAVYERIQTQYTKEFLSLLDTFKTEGAEL